MYIKITKLKLSFYTDFIFSQLCKTLQIFSLYSTIAQKKSFNNLVSMITDYPFPETKGRLSYTREPVQTPTSSQFQIHFTIKGGPNLMQNANSCISGNLNIILLHFDTYFCSLSTVMLY